MKKLLLIPCIIFGIYAQDYEGLLQEALQNSPYLKANALQTHRADALANLIERYQNPTISLELSNFNADVGGSKTGYRAALSQPIRLWGVGNDREALATTTKEEVKSLLSGIYLSVSAIVGFLAIFTIAILNGIVLVSFIDELREKFSDVDLKTLLKDATLLCLRPVLMTAFTTLFGILPLLYATGVGSEIQYPLAVVITGGIISSTVLTLLILPATYLLFYKQENMS